MIRRIIDDTNKLYNLSFQSYHPISKKAYKVKCCNGNEYFIKSTELYAQEKYQFLSNQGINNIMYPIKNIKGEYVSRTKNDFYVTEYISNPYIIDEVRAVQMAKELNLLHNDTVFGRQLKVSNSRPKMENIFEYLDYKFSVLELFVRSIESRTFDEYSIMILKNYHTIMETKKYMIKFNKKIVSDIKSKKTVDFSFIHNNPKLDHILISKGNKYLISIEKSKIGVSSLDMAKFYIENEDTNLDLKNVIQTYFNKFDDDFYYNYFCFLVLLFYVKSIVIIDKDYISSQSFICATGSIRKFLNLFEINKED